MLISLGWVVAGLVALVGGAELLVRSGSRLAARLGISPLVIGVTVVAIGTSAPELAVGVGAALEGSGSLAVGTVAGSNIVNILLVLGLGAVLEPLTLAPRTLRFGLPVIVIAALALLAMAWDGVLARSEGAVLVGVAIAYTAVIVRTTRRESQDVRARFAEEYGTPSGGSQTGDLLRDAVLLVVGIVVIVLGAGWLVDGGEDLALMLGVSDAFIGLTIVAIGTSAPELVTTVVATLSKERDIAVGTIIGSSVYNILLILGVTALVSSSGVPLEPSLVRVDLPVMVAAALVCIPVFVTGRRVTRLEGALLVGAYAVYLTYLLLTRT